MIFGGILILSEESFCSGHRWTYLVFQVERFPILRSDVPLKGLVSAGKGF